MNREHHSIQSVDAPGVVVAAQTGDVAMTNYFAQAEMVAKNLTRGAVMSVLSARERAIVDPEKMFGNGFHVDYVVGFYSGREFELRRLVDNPKRLMIELMKDEG